jgi:tripartite-type tricarboxylate transporter receptor subunit TctC
VAEAGFPGFQSTAWLGMVAPAKTPGPIVDRISAELVRIIRSDEVRNRMRSIYFQAIGTTPEGLATLMREEVERWGKVIKQTGARAD